MFQWACCTIRCDFKREKMNERNIKKKRDALNIIIHFHPSAFVLCSTLSLLLLLTLQVHKSQDLLREYETSSAMRNLKGSDDGM
jgi:hypothetical protein